MTFVLSKQNYAAPELSLEIMEIMHIGLLLERDG